MTGRHRRRSSKIIATVKGMILFTVALFLILGALWIFLASK
jgi:hypothetical protein